MVIYTVIVKLIVHLDQNCGQAERHRSPSIHKAIMTKSNLFCYLFRQAIAPMKYIPANTCPASPYD